MVQKSSIDPDVFKIITLLKDTCLIPNANPIPECNEYSNNSARKYLASKFTTNIFKYSFVDFELPLNTFRHSFGYYPIP